MDPLVKRVVDTGISKGVDFDKIASAMYNSGAGENQVLQAQEYYNQVKKKSPSVAGVSPSISGRTPSSSGFGPFKVKGQGDPNDPSGLYGQVEEANRRINTANRIYDVLSKKGELSPKEIESARKDYQEYRSFYPNLPIDPSEDVGLLTDNIARDRTNIKAKSQPDESNYRRFMDYVYQSHPGGENGFLATILRGTEKIAGNIVSLGGALISPVGLINDATDAFYSSVFGEETAENYKKTFKGTPLEPGAISQAGMGVAQFGKGMAEQWNENTKKIAGNWGMTEEQYEKGPGEALLEGDFSTAGKGIAIGLLHTMPELIATALLLRFKGLALAGEAITANLIRKGTPKWIAGAAGRARAMAPITLPLYTGANYAEVLDDPEFTTGEKLIYSVGSAFGSTFAESVGGFGEYFWGAAKKQAVDQVKSSIMQSIGRGIVDMLKAAGVEGAEEVLDGGIQQALGIALGGKKFDANSLLDGFLIGATMGGGTNLISKSPSLIGLSSDMLTTIKITDELSKIQGALSDPSLSDVERDLLTNRARVANNEIRRAKNNAAIFFQNYTPEDLQETMTLNSEIRRQVDNMPSFKTSEAKSAAIQSVKDSVARLQQIESKYDSQKKQQVQGAVQEGAQPGGVPVEGAGTEATAPGGVLQNVGQTQEEQVAQQRTEQASAFNVRPRLKKMKVTAKNAPGAYKMMMDALSNYTDEFLAQNKTTRADVERGIKSLFDVISSLDSKGRSVEIDVMGTIDEANKLFGFKINEVDGKFEVSSKIPGANRVFDTKEGADAYTKRVLYRGVNMMSDGGDVKISVLLPAMLDNTGYHEALHSLEVLDEDSVGKLVKGLKDALKKLPVLDKRMADFVKDYGDKLKDSEFLAELGSMISTGDISVEVRESVIKTIAKSFLDFFKRVTGSSVDTSPTAEQLASTFIDIAEKLGRGEKQAPYRKTRKKGEESGAVDRAETSQPKLQRIFADVIDGLYSPLENNILQSKQDKMPAKQWLDKFARTDEAYWTGLQEWLGNKQGSVSKQEIMDWLKDNRVEIREVVKGGLDGNDTKYSQYQLEGEKENYKELLVALPKPAFKKGEWFAIPIEVDGFSGKEIIWRLKNKNTGQEGVGAYETKELAESEIKKGEKSGGKTDFKSTHFEEPNILVHLRINTRADADYNKVLFLEEIQSDWGQKGKREGFRQDFVKARPDGENKWDVGGTKILYFEKGVDGKNYRTVNKDGEQVWSKTLDEANKVANERRLDQNRIGVQLAPFVTDTNAWTKLGLKIALREAVRQDADRLAWTTGEQQNERYDLSKQVDEIKAVNVNKATSGKYKWDITIKKDGDNIGSKQLENDKKLADYVGKDLAEKIITENPNNLDAKKYTGDNLKVGGKGMKGFYDKIVPDAARAIVRELTGVQGVIDETKIELSDGDVSTQKSIDITPELKSAVQSGIPKFQRTSGDEISMDDFTALSKRLNKFFKGNVKIVDADTFEKESEKFTGEKLDLKSYDGDVYGAVLPNGVMFINGLDVNSLLHEHTHLFNQVVMKVNPRLWSSIKDAVKKTAEWSQVKRNPLYSNLKTDDEVADEVFSKIVGNAAKNGWQKYTNQSIYQNIKALAQKFYNTILDLFGVDYYKGMSASGLADLTLTELMGGVSTLPYQIDAKMNELMSELFKGTKYLDQLRFNIDPNSRKKFEKALGEKDGRALYEIFGNVQDPSKLIDFAKSKFPIKGTLSSIAKRPAKNDYGLVIDNGNFGSIVVYKDYEKYLNEELKQVVDKATLDPQDLLNEVGYTLFNPRNLSDARNSFLHYYKKGHNICTLNPGSDRFSGSFVTFIVRNDADQTPSAEDLTQDNLTDEWRKYLEKNGRKNSDGTYNLNGLKPNALDPYSTSVISLQINKSNGSTKEISRYNHQISSPDNIFSRDFDNLIEGLSDAMFKKFGVEKNTKQSTTRMPNGVIQDANGAYYNYIYEINGVYYGDGYYLENGVATLLDRGSERMVDGWVISNRGDGTATNIDRTTRGFLYGDVKKVNYIKGDEISLTTENGNFVFEVKNGAVVRLIDFPKKWRLDKLNDLYASLPSGLQSSLEYDENGNLTLPELYLSQSVYINMLWADDIIGISSFADFYSTKIQYLGNLQYIKGDANFIDSQVKSLGELKYIGADARFDDSQVQSLGKLKYIGGNAVLGDSQIQSLGELKYIKGGASFRRSQVQSLGGLKYIGGAARFDESQIQSLEELKYIGGIARFDYSQIQSLGELRYIGGDANFNNSQVQSLGELKYIGDDADFWNSQVHSLGKLKYISGYANFSGSQIQSLGELKHIDGSAFFGDSQVKSLGELRYIGINASFNNSQVKSLGELRYIGGDARFADSQIQSLGELKYIGGNAYYSNSPIDSKAIEDIEGKSNDSTREIILRDANDFKESIEREFEQFAKEVEEEFTESQPKFQRIATFFSGAGTLEAAMTDPTSVMAVEYTPDYIKAYNEAFNTDYKARDVLDIDPQEVIDSNPDIFHASPTCKSFSKARIGTREAKEMDIKSAESVARVIRDAKPPVVTIENVPDYKGSLPYDKIISALKDSGYKYDEGIYNAADFGGIQQRRRLIIRAALNVDLPAIPDKKKPGDWFKALEPMIDSAPDSAFTGKSGDENWEVKRLLDMIKSGRLSADKPIITMGGSTDSGIASAANAGGPAPTLTSSSKQIPRIIMPDGRIKRVTPDMMRVLMGLPESYKIPDDWKTAKEVLGNGIDGAITRAIIEPMAELGERINQSGVKFQKPTGGGAYGRGVAEYNELKDFFGGIEPNKNRLFFADATNDFYIGGSNRSDVVLTIDEADFWLTEGPDGYVTIDDFQVSKDKLGTGKGKFALSKLTEYADKNGITLIGEPLAQAERGRRSEKRGLPQKQLIEFYKRNGFEKISKDTLSKNRTAENNYLERKPRNIGDFSAESPDVRFQKPGEYRLNDVSDIPTPVSESKPKFQTPIDEAFDRQQTFIDEMSKKRGVLRNLNPRLLDRASPLKKKLIDANLKNARDLFVAQAGAGSRAKMFIDENFGPIYNGLNKQNTEYLDKIIQLRRIIQIDEDFDSKGKPRIKHTADKYNRPINKEVAEKNLVDFESILGSALYNDLIRRSELYFDSYKKLLSIMRESGLITQELYDSLKSLLYQPRKFLDQFVSFDDGDTVIDIKDLALNEYQIKTLQNGSDSEIMMNSKLLLAFSAKSVFSRAARNKTYTAISEATKDPNNNGWISDKELKNFEPVNYFVDGVRKQFFIRGDFKKQLYDSTRHLISPAAANIIRVLSGSAVLKSFATQVNPLFALKNFPRDILHVAMFTNAYGNNLYSSIFRISRDAFKGMHDKMSKSADFKEWLDYGGGMDFLSTEGFESRSIRDGVYTKVRDALSTFGEYSEVGVRLAFYKKTRDELVDKFIKDNGRTPNKDESDSIKTEAAVASREIIDFAQGGSWAKAGENFIPYLNAAIQGFRVAINYIVKNPKNFAVKASQLALAVGMIMFYNSLMADDDDWEGISDGEKMRNFIIFLPLKDKDGNRYYLKIAKTQQAILFSTMFEIASAKILNEVMNPDGDDKVAKKYMMYGDRNYNAVRDGITSFLPKNPLEVKKELTSAIPLINAISAIDNHDTFFNSKVSYDYQKMPAMYEDVLDPDVPYFYKALSQSMYPVIQLGPKRMETAVGKITTGAETSIIVAGAYYLLDNVARKVANLKTDELNLGEVPKGDSELNAISSMFSPLKGVVKKVNPNLKKYQYSEDLDDIALRGASSIKTIKNASRNLGEKYYDALRGQGDLTKDEVLKEVKDYRDMLIEKGVQKSQVKVFIESFKMSAKSNPKTNWEAGYYDIMYSPSSEATVGIISKLKGSNLTDDELKEYFINYKKSTGYRIKNVGEVYSLYRKSRDKK